MNNRAVLCALLAVVPIARTAAASDNLPSPNLCPHTSNRYLYQDNVSAYDVKAKSFLKGSLITAAQLKVGDRTQAFVFMDDLGNSWVTLAPDADARTRSYFHGLSPPDMMLLSAFFAGPNHPLPKWAHLEKCPAP
ncbi:MAG: hypothetical protein M3169_11035 [Candidatus Eremiobacteraeota bacterium]|nr:hypothetical protein [Candidatus Eremiobacteraeota bacterium]